MRINRNLNSWGSKHSSPENALRPSAMPYTTNSQIQQERRWRTTAEDKPVVAEAIRA